MTARQRTLADGGNAAAAVVPVANGHTRPLSGPEYVLPVVSWEAWFRDASDTQRHALLELAQQQGLVYAHQVPPAANGVARKSEPAPTANKLGRWLTGQLDHLAPLPSVSLTFSDDALDLAQREAVVRAVATPDVCLIQGLPGTGKSRVAAEILHQCALRGERILFVSRRGGALDAALVRLRERPAAFAVRHLDPQESLEDVLPDVRACTLPRRRQDFHLEGVRHATQRSEEAERRCQSRRQQESMWYALRDLARRAEEHYAAKASLVQRLAALTANAECQAEKNCAVGDEGNTAYEAERTQLTAQCNANDKELAELAREQEALRPHADAKRSGRWWTLSWWKARFRGDVLAQDEQLTQSRTKAEEQRRSLQEDLERLNAKRQEDLQRLALERRRKLDEEIDRHRQALSTQQTRMDQDEAALKRAWQAQVEQLELADRPAEFNLASVDQAFITWQEARRRDEDACQLARQWQRFLEESGPALTERLLDHANIQAATLAGLNQLPRLFPRNEASFDVLLVDEAEGLTEADVQPLTALARRWVFIAEGPVPTLEESAAEQPVRPGAVAPGFLRPGFFQQLWRVLHGPESPAGCSWHQDGNRLVCCFQPVLAEEVKYLETESLADAPEIELRILTRPKANPVLAQVVFPAAMNVMQAKSYIFREMQELAVAPASRAGWWREDNGSWHYQFSPQTSPQAAAVALEDGVSEWVTSQGLTCSLQFVAQAGWRRERAEAWVHRHLRRRDLGRTALLEVPYRMCPSLAGPVQDVLFPAQLVKGAAVAAEAQELEFVRVPPLRKDEPRRGDKNVKPAPAPPLWPKEGAGLEQDLSAPRLAGRLPADLQAELPRVGVVNFLEAQAVVRKLEDLARTENFAPRVLVLALYESQVELLRRLAGRSEVLRAAQSFFAIGMPSDFVHQEAPVVLVSLTRSHVHRAVPFGADPREFVLALTRARDRLILFGDPGTLVKRSQWQGPLEHLDAATANQEGRRLARLVRCLSQVRYTEP